MRLQLVGACVLRRDDADVRSLLSAAGKLVCRALHCPPPPRRTLSSCRRVRTRDDAARQRGACARASGRLCVAVIVMSWLWPLRRRDAAVATELASAGELLRTHDFEPDLAKLQRVVHGLAEVSAMQRGFGTQSDVVLASQWWPEFWLVLERLRNYDCPTQRLPQRTMEFVKWHHSKHGPDGERHCPICSCPQTNSATYSQHCLHCS